MDRFADAVLHRGYNLVRIHIPEQFFVGWDIVTKYRKNTEKDVSIPQTVAELEEVLDKGNLDRFDYLVAAFRKRGIYVTFDLAGRAMITRVGTASHENGRHRVARERLQGAPLSQSGSPQSLEALHRLFDETCQPLHRNRLPG